VSQPDPEQMMSVNRQHWDAATPIHVASRFYNLDAVRQGAQTLADFELEELGPLSGLDVLHLQCHIGTDTLSLAREAEHTVGLDFSGESIAAARTLAAETGVAVEYVQADVYDATDVLGAARFDLVYTGKGALVWLLDIDRWARIVHALLKPGGVLYLVEFHPLIWSMVLDAAAGVLRLENDYLATGRAVEVRGDFTYTDGPPIVGGPGRTYEWNHDLGEVVTAVATAGLRIESLREIDSLPWCPWPGMVKGVDGWWRLPDGMPRLPLTYSLRAVRTT